MSTSCTSTTAPFTGTANYEPTNGYLLADGVQFPDGTVIRGGVSISQITFPAGITAVTTDGGSTGGDYLPARIDLANPISGPNVSIQYQLTVGGTNAAGNTNITDGETPVLFVDSIAHYSDTSFEELDLKTVPITSVETATTPFNVTLQQPLYFGTQKNLVGFSMQFQLYGASSTSTNQLCIQQTSLNVYYGFGR